MCEACIIVGQFEKDMRVCTLVRLGSDRWVVPWDADSSMASMIV